MAKKKESLSLEERLEKALLSDSEQPYKVPSNWVWTRLSEVVSIKTGKKDANYATDDGQYNFFTCAAEPLKCDDYSFDGESILVAGNGANVGLSLYFYGKFEAYQRTYVLQKGVKSELSIKFIFYHLQGFWEEYNKDKQYGSATNYIKMGNFKNYPIPLPPLGEQQRIVDCIESLFSKLDAAKENVQTVLDSFEKNKANILHKAFTGELTIKWREENGVSLDSWRTDILKNVSKISSGGTPSRTNTDYYTGNIPWIKTGEIFWNDIYDSEEKITNEALENSSAKVFPVDTVVVAMYGMGVTRGRAGILKVKSATNQAVCALIPNGNLKTVFLFYYFMNNYEKFRAQSVGGNQLNLSGKIISGFEINIPDLPEQTEIVRILDSILEKEQQAKELANVIEKIDLMKKAILARAFRGELGTNDPEEESAMELLKEILEVKS